MIATKAGDSFGMDHTQRREIQNSCSLACLESYSFLSDDTSCRSLAECMLTTEFGVGHCNSMET